MADVYVLQSTYDDIKEQLIPVLEALHIDVKVKNKKQILLKPNLVVASPPSTGLTTDPRVWGVIAEWLIQEVGITPNNIVVGDGGIKNTTDEALLVTGTKDMAERLGIRCRALWPNQSFRWSSSENSNSSAYRNSGIT